MIFECEFDISLKVASARFTFSLKSKNLMYPIC